jgi:hypothetical protein
MQWLARGSARHPWVAIAVFVIATAVCSFGMLRLRHEDDVLVFLPQGDADVMRFRDVSARFGSLRVALVGVSMRGEGDLLEAEALARIEAATKALAREPMVQRVTSLTNLTDVAISESGSVVEPLVNARPQTDAEHGALAARVLARELVVGAVITKDLRATTLMVHLDEGASTSQAVERIRAVAQGELSAYELHFAGAPFFAEAIYGEARRDVTKLSPIAAVILVLVVLLSFREIIGVALTFATVGFAVVVVLGTMGFVGERYTLLTSTLPVLLLATGSAYAVHVLGRYYLERENHGEIEAIDIAVAVVARPVAIAAWTTCVAFLAFLVMDVAPMRAFGLEVALGTAVCWLTAMTLLPAVLALVPRAPQREQLLPLGNLLLSAWRFTERHRIAVLSTVGALTVFLALPMERIAVKTEAQAFLEEGSPAWEAQQFFEERFGGARFVQLLVEGDLGDPAVLRRVAMLVERAGAEPGVTQVSSITDPAAMVIDLLGGGRRLPATGPQAAKAYLFLDGTPDIAPLMASDHQSALVQVRVRGEALPIVDRLEAWLDDGGLDVDPLAPASVARRLQWLTAAQGVDPSEDASVAVVAQLAPVAESDEEWQRQRPSVAATFLAGEEIDPLSEASQQAVVAALATGRTSTEAMRTAIANTDDAEFAGMLLDRAFVSARVELGVTRGVDLAATAMGVDASDPAVRNRLEALIRDALDPSLHDTAPALTVAVTGEPVLDRALSRSVARNQVRTMALGLAAVFVLLVLLFRSVAVALTCVAPAVITALALGGAMGLFGVQMDLSTAMAGAILTDTASDFGMHYLWYLRQQPHEEVVRTVGPIMIVSNVLVAMGFFAFAMGSSSVMHVFGSLSGATCVVSAIVACAIIPALWRWIGPRTPAA